MGGLATSVSGSASPPESRHLIVPGTFRTRWCTRYLERLIGQRNEMIKTWVERTA